MLHKLGVCFTFGLIKFTNHQSWRCKQTSSLVLIALLPRIPTLLIVCPTPGIATTRKVQAPTASGCRGSYRQREDDLREQNRLEKFISAGFGERFAAAPKALGDLYEAVAGAVFVDSGGDLEVLWKVSDTLRRSTHLPKCKACPAWSCASCTCNLLH